FLSRFQRIILVVSNRNGFLFRVQLHRGIETLEVPSQDPPPDIGSHGAMRSALRLELERRLLSVSDTVELSQMVVRSRERIVVGRVQDDRALLDLIHARRRLLSDGKAFRVAFADACLDLLTV